ncbi:amino acid adenylation domain-containing protein [Corallococcus sp. AB018]|uniref:amino acid adenylation domain-containing protein n=1 Tax=Corallococcus sp. AB018 TaxID=2316715 RepID=UPI000F8731E2|nr:amino acid adenylation domain-containing protein [Corallococcus sp. AB018]RUO95230.1 amino acid adenylation domain-containing protein [Corallococcus sp. AB018]
MSAQVGTGDVVLVLARRDDLHARLTERAKQVEALSGAAFVLVKPGRVFRRLGERLFQVDPDDAAHFGRLLLEVEAAHGRVRAILHLWNYEAWNVDYAGRRNLRSLTDSIAGNWRFALGAVEKLRGALAGRGHTPLVYVHHGEGLEAQPHNAIVGAGPAEGPPLVLHPLHVERRLPDLEESSRRLMSALESVVRGQPLPVPAAVSPGAAERLACRKGGVYLVVDPSGAASRPLVEELTGAHGCRVMTVHADALEDFESLRASVRKRIQDDFGRLDGVIQYLEPSGHIPRTLEQVLALDDITSELPLDFFALVAPRPEAGMAWALARSFNGLRAELTRAGRRMGTSLFMEGAPRLEVREADEAQDTGAARIDFNSEETRAEVLRLLTADVVGIVADMLGKPPASIDLGMSMDLDSASGAHFDSISLTRLADRIGTKLGLSLTPILFFKYKRLRAFIAHLHEARYPALSERYALRLVTRRAAQAPAPAPVVSAPAQAPVAATADGSAKGWGWLEPTAAPAAPAVVDARDVAIIGVSGRFPGGQDVFDFWKTLTSGKDPVTEIPAERWDWRAWFGEAHGGPNKTHIKWGSFLDGIDQFDPAFFGVSEKEAVIMDPSHRLLLETTWRLLEDAGYRASDVAGSRTGVFIGAGLPEYDELYRASGNAIEEQNSTGRSNSILANRVSFFFDFQGPSEAVDAACASSLVALHRALQSLRNDECTMAIAGGVHLILTPAMHVSFGRGGVLAADGKCRPFDKDAAGYTRAEGIGAVLLKPLHKALADGDNVYAVVRASAVSHGGRSNSMTSPNPNAQEALLLDVYGRQQVEPSSIQYVEAHGTGTPFGDSIEVASLGAAFERAVSSRGQPARWTPRSCGIGSLKSNIGHAEEAAGIAGVLKVVLGMRHGVLPGNLHFNALNPYIHLDGSPFYIVDRTRDWPRPAAGPRRGAVSAFGFGGALAHVVLEEVASRPEADAGPKGRAYAVPLSAGTPAALRAQAEALRAFLVESPGAALSLRDVAFTLQVGREPLRHRLAVVAHDTAELAVLLAAFLRGESSPRRLFTGQAAEPGAGATAVLADGDAERLAESWVTGGGVDWRRLATAASARRVSLPTYRFDKRRYWFTDKGPNPGGGGGSGPGGGRPGGPEATPVVQDYPRDKTFAELFAARAREQGDRVAALCAGRSISYRQLDEQSSLVAASLHALGVTRGTPVGIFFDRSLEMLISLLGVLKSGGTYVPLDPTFPDERLGYIARTAELGLLLTNRGAHGAPRWFSGRSVEVDGAFFNAAREMFPNAASRVAARATPDDIAYVLFTSGSTGEPKGIQVFQRGLAHFLCAMRQHLGMTSRDHLLAVTTLCFDIAGLELFLPLLCGARVEILTEEVSKDGLRLKDALERGAATFMQATPATWQMLVSAGWRGASGLTALCGGESLGRELADALLERVRGLWNLYGPTETTIWSTLWKVVPGEEIRIGGPIGDTTLHVLDEHLAPVPPGTTGELCIGGVGVAKGYLHKPELTAQRFIRDPFSQDPSARLYRTGDQVSLRPDGTLVYAGRVDNQVKLRGYRIELEEIEKVLQAVSGMTRAVVVVRADRVGQQALHAFCLGDGAAPLEVENLQARLRQRLPEYMVPAVFLGMRSFPMTLNAKVDRKALAALELDALLRDHGAGPVPTAGGPVRVPAVAPVSGDLEGALREVAASVLGVRPEQLPLTATFAQSGFNSVTLTALRARLLERLSVQVDPPALFKYPSVRALAAHLAERGVALPVAAASTAAPAREDVPEPIAIIGMASRFPGSEDPEGFFEGLLSGRDSVREVPLERWDSRAYFGNPKTQKNKSDAFFGGFISDVDRFDAAFFNVSPREARVMDPRQRLSLETVYKTFEDAGYAPSAFAGTRTGVFLGAINSDYWDVQREHGVDLEGYSLSGFAGSLVPNRVSFFFDLLGPSEAVDTACSSSLVAIHRAVGALRGGECDAAIAGGVNLILSPNLYLALSQNGMLSPDGRCKAFDQAANGYVRGEGIGTLLLKRLSDARRDGDTIHAVIRGSAVNHGGRANSLTAPNPDAQTQLFADAYAQAKVDLRTVSFIETHGTGTKLGDSIEVQSLASAFENAEKGQPPLQPPAACVMGAVKTNIGHLEAAAGIAGVIKAVMALRTRKLPGNLHFHALNPLIDLAGTPLSVATATRDWPASAHGHPRRAGVSSFGFGGASGHVVLEEFPMEGAERAGAGEAAGPFVFPLSAKTPERLRQRAQDLLAHLRRHAGLDARLADVAYTLQTGRAAMESRAAFVASNVAGLEQQLSAFLEGRETAMASTGGEAARSALRWASGEDVDWSVLHAGTRPRRVSLPTYPFEKQRHWVTEGTGPRSLSPGGEARAPAALGALVDANESTLDAVVFRKRLQPEARYLKDHEIGGKRILPAVVSLEMARMAGELASGGAPVTRLRNLVWLKPLAVDGAPRDAWARFERKDGAVEFKLVTGDGDVHVQGGVDTGPVEGAVPARVDVDAIRRRCTTADDRARFYQPFAGLGYAYGASLKPVERVLRGAREALVELQLPEGAEAQDAFVLHPSLLEGMLQSVAGLLFTPEGSGNVAFLPFSMRSVELFGRALPAACCVHVSVADGQGRPSLQSRFDLTLMSPSGEVLVRVRDYSVRPVKRDEAVKPEAATLYRTVLERADLTPRARRELPGPVLVVSRDAGFVERLRELLGGSGARPSLVWARPSERFHPGDGGEVFDFDARRPEELGRVLEALRARGLSPAAVIHGGPTAAFSYDADALKAQLQDGALRVFHLCQALLRDGLERPLPFLSVFPATEARPHPLSAALKGFARSVRLESDLLKLTVVQAERPDAMADAAFAELSAGAMAEPFVVHRDGARFVEVLAPLPSGEVDAARPVLPNGGACLITGGAGALGLHLTRHLLNRPGVRVALCGRSALTEARRTELDALRAQGADVEYFVADVTEPGDVEMLVDTLRARYGGIQGVIHAAGERRDQRLVKKTAGEFEAVLAPKVTGTLLLDRALAAEKLEFFAVFSSLVARTGNVGQTDYAFANAFLDGFRAFRDGLRQRGMRHGTSHAIAWPYWRDGGMKVDAATEQFIRSFFGTEPLETATGLDAFDAVLGQRLPEALVLGRGGALSSRFLKAAAEPSAPERTEPVSQRVSVPAAAPASTAALPGLLDEVRGIVAGLLQLEPASLDPRKDLAEYGYDSISFTELATALNTTFGSELTPAVFFELTPPSLGALASHLRERYGAKLAARASPPAPTAAPPSPAIAVEQTPAVAAPSAIVGADEPIAIIGMSGRMPGSSSLEAFWKNLEEGRSLVRVVPADRWDWRAFHGDAKAPGRNKSVSKWGGFLEAVDRFDAPFFGIPAEEARLMDPQQRLFLETVWSAIEDSGRDPASLSGTRTGLYVGVTNRDYTDVVESAADGVRSAATFGNAHAFLANRVSYLLNLHGPSEPVDTLCSSSLVAIHKAVEDLRRGLCSLALVGGVSVIASPRMDITFSEAGMLSPTGACRSFSRGADGFVRGEGSGALVLKPLRAAEADGDRILGVIRATGVNHGGRANSLTAPNGNAQVQLLRQVYERADIDPRSVSLIEAHGTGTEIGDAVELNSLKRAFQEMARARGGEATSQASCAVTCVKTNVGHLESAAGIAGVLKVLLALRHQTLPPLANLNDVNPYLDLRDSPFHLVSQATPWAARVDADGHALPRRAGVNSFGAGGANAHVVIDEYVPPARGEVAAPGPQVIPLSARDASALRRYAAALREHVAELRAGGASSLALPRLAYTLQTGRSVHGQRLAIVASDLAELESSLARYGEGTVDARTHEGTAADREPSPVLGTDPRALAWGWVRGDAVDWMALYGDATPARVAAPTYPFERLRYWFDAVTAPAAERTHRDDAPLTHGHWEHAAAPRAEGLKSGRGV